MRLVLRAVSNMVGLAALQTEDKSSPAPDDVFVQTCRTNMEDADYQESVDIPSAPLDKYRTTRTHAAIVET